MKTKEVQSSMKTSMACRNKVTMSDHQPWLKRESCQVPLGMRLAVETVRWWHAVKRWSAGWSGQAWSARWRPLDSSRRRTTTRRRQWSWARRCGTRSGPVGAWTWTPLPGRRMFLQFQVQVDWEEQSCAGQCPGTYFSYILPVEYSVLQSSFLVEISSNCGSSMSLLTSSGIIGSQMKTRSPVVCETETNERLIPEAVLINLVFSMFFSKDTGAHMVDIGT